MKGKQSYYVEQGQINNSECDDYLLKSSGAANSLNAFDRYRSRRGLICQVVQ
ncbi:hypothetical protein Syun_009797 [Stephania yunnanensis]|uniref:Uncharacterized protein n=1 Tax=Stephania yunnanensis TaxID=152371 RepID=A0AAP0KGU4_9MAGN